MILILQHQVRDYDARKRIFDEHLAVRARHGATGHELCRSLGDSHDITTVRHLPSREQAEALAADPALKEAMDLAGAISEPCFTWAEETEAVDYTAKAARVEPSAVAGWAAQPPVPLAGREAEPERCAEHAGLDTSLASADSLGGPYPQG